MDYKHLGKKVYFNYKKISHQKLRSEVIRINICI